MLLAAKEWLQTTWRLGASRCFRVPRPHQTEERHVLSSRPPRTGDESAGAMYQISCRINEAGDHAVCIGSRRFGAHPGQRVVAHAVLRDNGSWDLLCWPNPTALCDRVQVREQRANPITSYAAHLHRGTPR